MTSAGRWTRSELILVFDLYCSTPFGQLHQRNPDIVRLATDLGRSPGAIAMKAVNFASLDPRQVERGIKGLSNVSQLDRDVWDSLTSDWSGYLEQLDEARLEYSISLEEDETVPVATESVATRVERRAQGYFRKVVLSSYGNVCAMTGLAMPSLLNASHIMPWSHDVARRLDPTNGISLNVLHDRAFDRGLISFNNELELLISPRLRDIPSNDFLQAAILRLSAQRLRLPDRFAPSVQALEYHRDLIFQP
jgi:hypothetical protein